MMFSLWCCVQHLENSLISKATVYYQCITTFHCRMLQWRCGERLGFTLPVLNMYETLFFSLFTALSQK